MMWYCQIFKELYDDWPDQCASGPTRFWVNKDNEIAWTAPPPPRVGHTNCGYINPLGKIRPNTPNSFTPYKFKTQFKTQ